MICETCKHQPKRCSYACDYGEMIGCSFYTPRIATKADEIRNMTDEELAHFLSQWGTATKAWQKEPGETLYWLQQPAETEGKK